MNRNYFYLFLIFQSLLFQSLSAESVTVIDYDTNLGYKIVPNSLVGNKMAFAVDVFESTEFQDDLFSYLDIFNVTNKSNAFIVASKTAFTISGRSPDYFSEELLIDPNFIEKLSPDSAITKTSKPSLFNFEKETTIDSIGKTVFIEGTLASFHFPNGTIAKPLSSTQLGELNRVDKSLGTPEKIILFQLNSVVKYIHGNYTILKLYPQGASNTLVVLYQIITVKPEDWWPIPRFILKQNADSESLNDSKFTTQELKRYSI